VTSGGIGIAAFEAGLSEPDAPVLVLVHGMGHWTQAAWDFVAADFETSHRIVAFDLPGFGASDKPRRAYTPAFFTDVLREVVVDAGVGTFALAGHSLGGLIAAHYAVRFPRDVRSLTLIAPAGFLRTPKLVLRVMGSRPVIALLQAIKPSRAFVLRTLDSAVFDPAVLRSADKERAVELAFEPAVSAAFARVYAGAMHELLHLRKLHARLAAWRGPTLLVWGRQDRFVPFGGLASARKVYPQADVLAIDRCGHCPNVEYPALVTERMRANGV
jgi:4,5:9,10-diseco-3-hydroxy-5,9,17-trioxoandrosta-1(10),2-diene-4-oate hydrolase